MLPILRTALPECARGLSTALALLAGNTRCPDCSCAPVLHCPDIPSPADCVCSGSSRVCPVFEPLFTIDRVIASHIFTLVVGICIGLFCRHSSLSKTSESPSRSSSTELSTISEGLQFPGLSGLQNQSAQSSSAQVSPASIALARIRQDGLC